MLLAGIDVEGLNTLLLRLDVEPPAGILPAEAAALEVIEDGRVVGVAIAGLFGTGAGLGIGFDTGIPDPFDFVLPLFQTLCTSDLADDKKPNLEVCALALSVMRQEIVH